MEKNMENKEFIREEIKVKKLLSRLLFNLKMREFSKKGFRFLKEY